MVVNKMCMPRDGDNAFLPSANEVCEGYVFTRVCHSVHGGGCLQAHTQGEVEGSGQVGSPGPYPGGEGWGVWLVGSPDPYLGGRLRGLAGGSPGPYPGGGWGSGWGVSRPRPGGGSRLRWGGVCVSQHALRQTPSPMEQTATAADGTHPTGMHSCFIIKSVNWEP